VQLVLQVPVVSQMKRHRPPVQVKSQSASSWHFIVQPPDTHAKAQLALPAQTIVQAPHGHDASQEPLLTQVGHLPVVHSVSQLGSGQASLELLMPAAPAGDMPPPLPEPPLLELPEPPLLELPEPPLLELPEPLAFELPEPLALVEPATGAVESSSSSPPVWIVQAALWLSAKARVNAENLFILSLLLRQRTRLARATKRREVVFFFVSEPGLVRCSFKPPRPGSGEHRKPLK
jgi:hypothetical protein